MSRRVACAPQRATMTKRVNGLSRAASTAVLAGTAAIAIAIAAPSTASAAPPTPPRAGGIALNQLEPAPAGDAFFGVPGPATPGHIVPRAFVMFDYADAPLVLFGPAGPVPIVASQGFLRVDASVSLWERLLISLDLPVAVAQSGEEPPAGVTFNAPQSAEVGDLRVGARGRLLGQPFEPFQLALEGFVFVPTGAGGSYAAEGFARFGLHASIGGRFNAPPVRFVWSASLGTLLRTSGNPHGLTFGAGVAALFLDDRIQVGPELYGSLAFGGSSPLPITGGTTIDAESRTAAELLMGARVRVVSGLFLGAAGGPGLSAAIGTPAYRVIGQVGWAPPAVEPKPVVIGDRDDDGIRDDVDACPNVKGELNPDPKKDGCPPQDKDGDGIIDIDDACPADAGERRADLTTNGCPDDTDQDGVADKVDACPEKRGPKSEVAAKNGCPPDRDDDGVEDALDACPDTKGVASEEAKRNGCPDDVDNDGVKDVVDACPQERGYPDPDPAKSGCPRYVRYTGTELVLISKQVQFKNYGRHKSETVDPISDDLLREVRDIINQHPEIQKLEVQGHTDDTGDAPFNMHLSQERADTVRQWLIDAGIPESKLVAKGYGHTRPIADNRISEGRQKNRRVQFVIIQQKK